MANERFQAALQAIEQKKAKIGIMGLGYVGLPLARIFAKAGFSVVGFDVDPKKVEMLNAGQSYIMHLGPEVIKEMTDTGRFHATANFADLASVQAILICVPTPLTEHHDPDMTYVVATSDAIAKHLQPGQLVILESTTYPGTTRDVVQPILEKTGLKAGSDFFLAYSPEREDPGNATHSAAHIPKVVGGIEPMSLQLACAVYAPVVPKVVPVSSPDVAEASKILENTYRCVNIALVNELKMLFEKMGIDIWEVIQAASTKPFGFQPFYPGPGLGGHCIPIDPFYLSWVAKQFQFRTRFIELAGEINTAMPAYVVQRLSLALNSAGKPIKGSKICIMGMAYKKDVDDPRESPSFELMEMLIHLGANVTYNDPHIPKLPKMRQYKLQQTSQDLTPAFLKSQDCLLIATDHSVYQWDQIVPHAQLIVDSRGATRKIQQGREKIWTT